MFVQQFIEGDPRYHRQRRSAIRSYDQTHCSVSCIGSLEFVSYVIHMQGRPGSDVGPIPEILDNYLDEDKKQEMSGEVLRCILVVRGLLYPTRPGVFRGLARRSLACSD